MKNHVRSTIDILCKTSAGIAACFLSAAALSDDLSGENEILCSSASVVVCRDDGSCESAPPWKLNVPQFIEVNLKKRLLATTEASGENRSTTVDTIKREDGLIYLQGVDGGRAYSWVIHEASGFITVAVARQDTTVTLFGACTPTSR